MKINEVSVTFSFTKNLGNYQSLRAEASVVSQLEKGENAEEVFEKIFNMAKKQVKQQTKLNGVN